MFELLKELLQVTVDALRRTKFNQGDPRQRMLMALYATIIEHVDSAVELVERGRNAGVEAILRACLEAHVDLLNLAKDDDYKDQMAAAYHEQWIPICKDAVVGMNPFLAGMQADAPKALAEHEAELKRLGKPLKVRDRFEKANLRDLYYSIYNSLCCETHNNLRSLMDRHFRNSGTEKAPKFEIHIFSPMAQHDFDAAIDACYSILIGSNRVIQSILQSAKLAKLDEFAKRREDFYVAAKA